MNPADFDYSLPPERIAQRPARPRDAARLLLLRRETSGEATEPVAGHAVFRDLPDHLREGDLLVVNDTRVLAARLRGRKQATGGGIEILLLERTADVRWRALARGLGRAAEGTKLSFTPAASAGAPEGELEAELLARAPDGSVAIAFSGPAARDPARLGEMPIPPYIRRGHADLQDRDDYQTCFAGEPGAVAAPTASLHFTPAVLQALGARGVQVERLTLHVGWGTFAPLDPAALERGRLHEEGYAVKERTALAINQARSAGRRIIAAGTTTARALESAAAPSGEIRAGRGVTDLFIRPGYRFRCVDGLITNFHLPRSSLLMMVCAFAGRSRVLAAYCEAVQRGYRFYSYGDAMLIL